MSTGSYRLTVVGCALLWLLVGLHVPLLHQVLDHGRMPGPMTLAAVVGVVAGAVGVLWALLRAPSAWPPPPSAPTVS